MVGLLYLVVQFDRVGAEDLNQVQSRGQHRLQQLGGDRRGGVPRSARRHFGDRCGGGTAPGPKVGADLVGGEQVPVVDQINNHLCSGAADGGAAFADDHTVLNASVTHLVRGDGGWELVDFSDVAHLQREGADVTAHPGSPDVEPA